MHSIHHYLYLLLLWLVLITSACGTIQPDQSNENTATKMVRIAEIEIDPVYLEEYLSILKEEAAASIRLEPGVVSIFPMALKEQPASIRIVEIYASREAYEAHLETPHFLKYKAGTLHMVKSLKLVEMQAIDEEAMRLLFKKMP